ncbi:MAG: rRNA adenine dimethyltransferase family protein, partial [Patescibacteria group bacterium]
MNLTSKSDIKELLEKYNAKPEKYLGQHFILSKKAIQKMVETAEITTNDTIIEVGPGLGTLTKEIAENPACRQAGGANIIAIEKDPLMINILKETLSAFKNIKVTQADARKTPLPPPNLSGFRYRVKRGKDVDKFNKYNNKYGEYKNGYKIVANLPYNVATFLIRQWLELNPANDINDGVGIGNPLEMMVLIIQKEVAQRIIAKPPRSNLLAISVQFYADARIIDYIKKESFWPKPKVDAAIIKIIPTRLPAPDGAADGGQEKNFFRIIKAGFSQPRKQLIGNLVRRLNIPKEKIVSVFRDFDIS